MIDDEHYEIEIFNLAGVLTIVGLALILLYNLFR